MIFSLVKKVFYFVVFANVFSIATALAEPPCVDVVVVAVPYAKDFKTFSYDNESFGLATYQLKVKHVIFGQINTRSLTAYMIMNEFYVPRDSLLFLRNNPDGYEVVRAPTKVAKNDDGHFVVPLFEEPKRNLLYPNEWIPSDYQNFLHPIHYSYNQTWWAKDKVGQSWLKKDFDNGSSWISEHHGHYFAKQGLDLDEMAPWLAQRDSHNCFKPKP